MRRAMTPERFRNLVEELGSENPLAIRPFLRILGVRYTTEVPTLAVTCEERPALLVNPGFLDKHCETDDHVKAVILHEFLHVLLRHTEKRGPVTPAEHIATDAVINAVIHRQMGPSFSSMMKKYYGREKGVLRLLRPPDNEELWECDEQEKTELENLFVDVWEGLYDGSVVVDDIREIAEDLAPTIQVEIVGRLLGNHDEEALDLPPELLEAVTEVFRSMNGGGIWRSPFSRGVGAAPYETLVRGDDAAAETWKRKTLEVLKRYVMPDANSRNTTPHPLTYMLPVLSTGDRRAFVRAMWSLFLPEASWTTGILRPAGTTQIYLDVSGSMDAEMPLVIALLGSLRRYIRMPFWAFSDSVSPATIRNGALVTKTTGGTSIRCVLEHIAKTHPESAVIVTDGYIERVERDWVERVGAARIHALVTRDGSTKEFDRGRIECTQLEKLR